MQFLGVEQLWVNVQEGMSAGTEKTELNYGTTAVATHI